MEDRALGKQVAAIAQAHNVHVPEQNNLAACLQRIGDELRSPHLRNQLGATELPNLCVEALRTGKLHTHTEALRVLGNLCIDHGVLLFFTFVYTDENRHKVAEAHAPLAVLEKVQALAQVTHNTLSPDVLGLLVAAFGALLNMQMDYLPTQRLLRDARGVQTISVFAASPYVHDMGHWVQTRTFDSSESVRMIEMGATAADWGLRVAHELLSAEEIDTPSADLVWTRSEVLGLLKPLNVYKQHTHVPPDYDELIEKEITVVESLAALLAHEALHGSSFCSAALAGERPDAAHLLLSFLAMNGSMPAHWSAALNHNGEFFAPVAEEATSQARRAVTQLLVAIAAHEESPERLCPLETDGSLLRPCEFVDTLHAWIVQRGIDPALAVCAMLTLGNLARDQERSEALAMLPGLVDSTVSWIELHSKNPGVLHAALGLLGNLAVPETNKPRLAFSGVLFMLVPLLNPQHRLMPSVQQGAISLVRHLVAGSTRMDIVLEMLGTLPGAPSGILEALIDLWRSSDQPALRLLLGRTLLMLIRRAYSATTQSSVPEIACLRQLPEICISNAFDSVRAELAQTPVADALCELVSHGQKHAVLMSEGFLGLALLASSERMYLRSQNLRSRNGSR